MSDNLQHSGGQDRTRIDVHQDYELRDWADGSASPRSSSSRPCRRAASAGWEFQGVMLSPWKGLMKLTQSSSRNTRR